MCEIFMFNLEDFDETLYEFLYNMSAVTCYFFMFCKKKLCKYKNSHLSGFLDSAHLMGLKMPLIMVLLCITQFIKETAVLSMLTIYSSVKCPCISFIQVSFYDSYHIFKIFMCL